MQTYDDNAACKKCGCKIVLTYWRAAYQPGIFSLPLDGEPREHMHRVCTRCNFEWNEAPIEGEGKEKR